ncbi:MAG: hypothetical protein WA885_24710 [Phormidesmis sp.]
MPFGINLTLLIGATVPKPASRELMEALHSVEVKHTDEGRAGFQIVFQAGRAGRRDLQDYKIAKNPLLQVFNRVILVVRMGAAAEVLMDGIITNQQLSPHPEPGKSTYTITGEDVSVMMDLEEESTEHQAQDEATIARLIIAKYAKYGLVPQIVDPAGFRDRPTPNERIPTQQETDLQYLQTLAQRFAHVFYIIPGPTAGANVAYWGPPQRKSRPQKALTVNMGSFTNVTSVNFQNNALAAAGVTGSVQDRKTNNIRPVQESRTDRPLLARQSALTSQRHKRVRQFRETGRDVARADARAQAMTDRSVDDVVTVSGELETVRYGGLLRLRGLVGLRGVGNSYDGHYYVKNVTHTLGPGQYKQSFTITREGLGSTVRRVAV